MFFNIVEVIVVTLMCCLASVRYVHKLQMGRYQVDAYRNWVALGRMRLLRENIIWAIVGIALKWYLPMLLSMFINVETTRSAVANWLTLAVFGGALAWIMARELRMPSKKPFAFTLRMRRLCVVVLVITLLPAALLAALSIPPYLVFAAMPFIVLLAAMIINPYENRLNAGFFKSARDKIRKHKNLITIGITGSYGKTNVKFILKEILSQKYNVLATPASFNTAMGISRVINDQLTPEHEVFIAEMGATHVGDIKELVDLVHPKHGILTSIGPRHVDTFGSLANIAETKFELIQGLPKDGIAIFGSDDDYIDRLYAKCAVEKYRISMDENGQAYMKARVVGFGPKGSSFFMECADGEKIKCRTRLLGGYNIKNILLAAAMARRLGLTMEEIAEGIRRLQPIEHRMQLIGDRDVVFIDNSFNEEPDSAFEAARVLSQMPGRRIIVTPGLADASGRETDVNFAFGTVLADCADSVILIGERPGLRGLIRGLIETGFARTAIHSAADLEDGEEILREIASKGDTVLFEGRIPDYEEA